MTDETAAADLRNEVDAFLRDHDPHTMDRIDFLRAATMRD